jgi:hypothetical protein
MAARFDTAGTIINDVAVEVGLSAVTDPFASSDPNFILLCKLLKNVGRKLALARDWTSMVKEHTFTTVNGTVSYDLPASFAKMIDQTGWDRTGEMPLGGPLSSEQWQYLAATDFGTTIQVFVRFWGDKIHLYPTPGATVLTIAFEYLSRLWVMPSGETSATEDIPDASTDTILFDPILMVSALELAWAKAKGFDTTAALEDFQQAWSSVAGNDSPAPVLSLTRGPMGPRFLDMSNVPDTGYGT